ncbi:DUF4145 domain-containing protein [Candidatus Woesearchaeota archaeon]|nr:DUF4145 domain-containing protein [Candidatus Woesearchaeota archaeon]
MAFDAVEDLKMALIGVLNHNISLVAPLKKKIMDYKEQRSEYYRTLVRTNLAKIKETTKDMDEATKKKVSDMEALFASGDAKTMIGIVADLSLPKPQRPITHQSQHNLNVPHEIRDDIFFDLSEIDKCMNANAYRSAMILCARVLETALHRKYYDFTGKDLLETSPGIGLGNIISKMRESGIEIDPALTQQVHLINNVRIFSVHKKQNVFQPSREQAQATFLFTIDILKKLF